MCARIIAHTVCFMRTYVLIYTCIYVQHTAYTVLHAYMSYVIRTCTYMHVYCTYVHVYDFIGAVCWVDSAGSIKNVRPPLLMHPPSHRVRVAAHQQCNRNRRSRKGGRLRLSRVSANGIYDTNYPQSYVSPVRRQWAASQVDELWDRWRVVEVKKRRRT